MVPKCRSLNSPMTAMPTAPYRPVTDGGADRLGVPRAQMGFPMTGGRERRAGGPYGPRRAPPKSVPPPNSPRDEHAPGPWPPNLRAAQNWPLKRIAAHKPVLRSDSRRKGNERGAPPGGVPLLFISRNNKEIHDVKPKNYPQHR